MSSIPTLTPDQVEFQQPAAKALPQLKEEDVEFQEEQNPDEYFYRNDISVQPHGHLQRSKDGETWEDVPNQYQPPAPPRSTQPLTSAGPQLTPSTVASAAAAKPAIAQYPENQPLPSPDYLARRKAWEAVQGEPGAPAFDFDEEQERRIRAQEEAAVGRRPATEAYVAPTPSLIPTGHGLSRTSASVVNARKPVTAAERTEPVIGTALQGVQENVNEPRARLSEAGSQAVGNAAEQVVAGEMGLTPEGLRNIHPRVAGITRATGATVGGMVADPAMWPFFFAGPEVSPALRAATGAGFAGQMGVGAVQQASELGAIMDNPNIPEDQKWEMGASAVVSAIMAGTGGAHLLKDFSSLPEKDQAQIRERVRAKAPELAGQMDNLNAGKAPAQAIPELKPDQVEVQTSGKYTPSGRFKLQRGTSAAEVSAPVKAPNIDTVTLDNGQIIAFDKRKVNADAVKEAARTGNLWKLTGGKAPAEAVEAAKQEITAQPPPAPAPAPVAAPPPEVQPPVQPERRRLTPEGERIDRRTNPEQRKLVAEMTSEERAQALLTSDRTGLPNRRAFDEAEHEPAKALAMSDSDGLKAVNDKFGYSAGNAMLKAKAEALQEAGIEAYHDKGDEFIHRGESAEDLNSKLEKAREILRGRVIEFEDLDTGKIRRFSGADFSYGAGEDLKAAESALHSHKEGREARGERARGELRGITELKPEEVEVQESPAEKPEAHQDLAAAAAAAHNAGDTEAAKKALKELVRQQLGKKEETPAAAPEKRIDYEYAKKAYPRQKSALTKAESLSDPQARKFAVLKAATEAVNEWEEKFRAWPDNWSRWQRALDDAYHKFNRAYGTNDQPPRLDDLFGAETPEQPKPVSAGRRKLTEVVNRAIKAGAEPITEKPVEEKPTGYGSKNTVFTADKKDAALARLRAKKNTLNTGIDPEVIKDLIDVGGYHFEAGLREFADWSKQMLLDVGDWAKPYLETIHDEISSILGGRIERGHETGQPEGRAERPEVQGPGGQGGHAPEHPSTEAVRGAEGERETPEPSGVERPRSVERGEQLPPGGPAPEPGGRVEPGTHPSEERAAGRRRERGADGKPVEAATPEEAPRAIDEEHTRRDSLNYRYKEPAEVGKGGEMAKIDQNIAAIKLLKELTEQGRHATPEEQDILAKYTGWGGLSGIFNRRYERQYAQRYEDLSDLLGHEEMRGIQRSTINAHYTSPEVIDFMWKLAKKMGFEGGRVIEPGMGVGYFFGLMPEEMRAHPDTRLLGVELDPTTGRIAQELYQGAKILNTGYEKVQIPDNSLDFAVGNVPFADVKPFDPRYNKLQPRPTLHDYYFLKTLDKVRPGGIVSFITSRYTMDKVDNRIREMIAERADLVAAYRLPNTAFKGVAGDEVTADLMILRKRAGDETRGGEPFRDIVEHKEGLKINQYFQAHPENMFGEMTLGGTMYGKNEATLEPRGELADHLRRAIDNAPTDVYDSKAAEPDAPAFVDPTLRAPDHIKEGQFYLENGELRMKRNGVPVEIPKELQKTSVRQHIKAAIDLREKAAAVLQQMLADKDDEPLKPLQAELNRAYDSYTKKYGSTHARDLADNFGSDPDYGLLLALENLDKEAGKYVKADIFSKRTMRPYEPPGALPDEPESWVPASLAAKGKLDPEYIGELAGKDAKQVIQQLEAKGLVFRDPESGEHLTSDEYLSGEVRNKLNTARKAAEVDPAFQKNVEALEKVQPEKIPIGEIQPKLGMSWIPGSVYESFIHDMAESSEYQRLSRTRYRRGGASEERPVEVKLGANDNWEVVYSKDFNGVPLSNKFGTKDVSGAKIIDDTINLRQTNIYQRDAEGKPKLDKEATLSAREAQQRLKDAFTKWFYDTAEHHPLIEQRYNDTFNGNRLREFDGSHLTFPGMNPDWNPRSHQANAIWRQVVHGRALLAHAVGAGKTLEMIGAGMEMRRLGISRKNMYAVPNNMVGQWSRDFARIYPASRVLSAPEKGFEGKDARNEFMAKAATGDWDAVVVPHSVFDLVPVSEEWQTKTINKELESARESLAEYQKTSEDSQQTMKRTVKQMEKKILKLEARLEKLSSGKKDNALRFDQLGVDTLFVDEAHRYKNLQVNTSLSNVAGVPTTASQRSLDMLMKSQYMLETHNGRGLVFATGTPVTNTMAEVYNMSRFVAPDVLEKAGIRTFDQWRANFAEERTDWQYAPDDVTFRPVTALKVFINVPELATMFRTFADVKTKEDLNLPVPKADRKDIKVTVNEDQSPLLQQIADRAEHMRKNPRDVDPKVDNWLKLSSDARKISLDPRLYVKGLEEHADSKLNAAVRETKRIYDRTKEEKGLQILFSDFFAAHDLTTDTEWFNALKEIKRKLIGEGVPEREIALVTDYSKGQMDQLQEDARNGKIRVLMGSTEKLGVGLNVQRRLAAIHHLDQPWRPADVEQREGRILRQGNEYPNVEILRYISEPQSITSPKAFDLQMFQKLEAKAKFIDQFMQGGMKNRRIEDLAGRAMLTPEDFAIAKAMATGNPDAMKKIQLEHETNRLYLLQRDWTSKRSNSQYQAHFAKERAMDSQAQLEAIKEVKDQYDAWDQQPEDNRLVATIDGREFRSTSESKGLKQVQDYLSTKHSALELAGKTYDIMGVEIPVRSVQHGNDLNGQPVIAAEYQLGGWHKFETPSSFFGSVASRLRNLEKFMGTLKDEIELNKRQAESYQQQLNEKSPYEDKLNEAEKELTEINKRLGIGGVSKAAEQELGQIQEEEPEPEETEEEEPGQEGERGSATPAAMPIPALVSAGAGAIKKGINLYHGAVDKLVNLAHMGETRPEIRQFDPDAADLATKMDAAGQYHKAVAEWIANKVEGPLREEFKKEDNFADRQRKNEITRDRMKGLHWMGDAQNREWLEEHHPEEFHRWSQDPKIAEALKAYKPYEDQLRQGVKQLGGKTIDEDYIKRIMDFNTSGVVYEKGLPPGVEGPVELREGRARTGGAGRDNVVSPQIDRSKARKDAGQYYWDHGVYDFGPSFQKRWIEVMSKLDEHRLAVHAMSMGTRIASGEEQPDKIFYNGQEFYRPDLAREIREVQKRGVSSESKALADALGVSELPTPKHVREYGLYEPLRRGSRFENAARNLATNVIAGKEDLVPQAANLYRMSQLKYAIPREIADALNDAGREKEQGALSRKITQVIGPITQFIRQQIVGLAYGVPHMGNILRKVVQVHPGAALNPMGWVDAFKVAFSKELKARGISGVEDPTYNMLLRNAAINEGAIPDYKHYIEGNFDLKSWEGIKGAARTATRAFRKGGRAGAEVTPLSAVAGVGRLAVEPLNRFSEAGHRNLFQQGAIDQRARLWLADFLKDRYKGISDEKVAQAVNQTLGRYNRASWTDVQKGLAPFMLFPGWDYSSMTFALKHPFKTAIAPAILMLLANAAVRGLGGQQKQDEKYDTTGIHIGKYKVRTNLLNDNMGGHFWGWALRGASAALEGKSRKAVAGEMVKGVPGDVAGVSTGTLNPVISTPIQLGANRLAPGSGQEIIKEGDLKKRGKVLPNKGAEDLAEFGARRLFPIYDRAMQAGQRPSLASAAGLVGATVTERKKRKR